MPEQMVLLRNALEARKIEYWDDTDKHTRSFPFLDMCIYRTKYMFRGHYFCAISGIGTFGGDRGLLELTVDDSDPIGSLSASTILRMMDDDKFG